MHRTEISYSGIYTSDFIGIIFPLSILTGVSAMFWSGDSLLIIVISTSLMAFAFLFFVHHKSISFDSDNIYFRKSGQKFQIPIGDIRELRINRWLPIDSDRYSCSIVYSNPDGSMAKVRFIPFSESEGVERFILILRAHGKDVPNSIA